MLEKYVRSTLQHRFILPLAKRLPSITPLSITLFGCLLGILAAFAIGLQHAWIALTLLLASGLCDILDGTIARLTQNTTPLGSVCDIMADRVVESSVILGLFWVSPTTRALLCLLMLVSILICITSFLVVGIFTANQSEKSFHYSPGLIERPEAFLFFIFMILFPSLFTPLAVVFIGLVLLTAAIRLLQFVLQRN